MKTQEFGSGTLGVQKVTMFIQRSVKSFLSLLIRAQSSDTLESTCRAEATLLSNFVFQRMYSTISSTICLNLAVVIVKIDTLSI